jgi:menaquinone-dependent protoporphyrinogen IX oxidase
MIKRILVTYATRAGSIIQVADEIGKTLTVHILNLGDDEQNVANLKAYLAPIRPLIKPVGEIFFSGKVDLARLSLTERLMARAVKSPVGDFRDWTKICGWADTVFAL